MQQFQMNTEKATQEVVFVSGRSTQVYCPLKESGLPSDTSSTVNVMNGYSILTIERQKALWKEKSIEIIDFLNFTMDMFHF